MRCLSELFFIIFLFTYSGIYGQHKYQLKLKKEIITIGAGSLTLGLGIYLQDETTLFTPDKLETFNPKDINAFDRIATDFSSARAHRLSNYFFYGSAAAPALLLLGDMPRKEAGAIGLMWFETMLVNGGATHLCKHAFHRPRPFVFDENAEPELKMTTNAQASFVSGHTSVVVANCFFAATVFSEYYPDSPWKNLVWGMAASAPAITGYLRVRAGRHYPTDVIGGYALGAIIGWGIPAMHRVDFFENNNVEINGGLTGINMRWNF